MVKEMREGGVKKPGKSGDIFMDGPFLNSSTNSEKVECSQWTPQGGFAQPLPHHGGKPLCVPLHLRQHHTQNVQQLRLSHAAARVRAPGNVRECRSLQGRVPKPLQTHFELCFFES